MNLQQLENILALAECGNITKTAEKLYITQSTLTQQLLNEEASLGTTIFDRQRSGLKLTKAGEIYISAIRQILEIQRDAYRQISEEASIRSATLKIGATRVLGSSLTARSYKDFHQAHPETSMDVTVAYGRELRQLVENRTLDFAVFTVGDEEIKNHDYEILLEEEMVLVSSKESNLSEKAEHMQNGRQLLSIKDIENEPLILPAPNSMNYGIIDKVFRKAGVRPRRFDESGSPELQKVIVEENHISAMIEMHNAYRYFLSSSINIIYLKEHPKLYIVAFYRKDKKLGKSGIDLIRIMKSILTADEKQWLSNKNNMGLSQ